MVALQTRKMARGIVSNAVPCLFNGVICDLPFNIVGLPKKMGGMIAHPAMIRQSPRAAFSRRELPYADGKLRVLSRIRQTNLNVTKAALDDS